MNDDIYGRSVVLTSQDSITDYYLVGGSIEFTFPTGTSGAAVYVAFARQGKLAQFQLAVRDFVNIHYDLETRWNLNALYMNAQATLKVNRQAYIAQLFTWATSVIGYVATFAAAVNSSSDPATIAAMNWTFSSIAADPGITPMAAIAIGT